MRQINQNLFPPGGYKFKDRDGMIHHDEGWRKLEARVIDYRRRNKMEPGQPWAEMMTQVCGEVPGFCADNTVFVLQPDRSGMDFNQHVVAWLGHAAGYKRIGQWNRIDDATAARRAAICSTCPMQRSLNNSCGACITQIDNLRRALLNGKKPQHQNLHPCGVTFEDCQSTVHIQLPPSDSPNLPAHCWRRS